MERRFGLFQATALNMANMIGVGPFITIPTLMSAMGGPQSLLGWALALLITLPDSLVWAELGAMMPNSGGSYGYLKQAFGPAKWGRLIAFLFIWQFIFSGPLEIASGFIGMANYAAYLFPGMSDFDRKLLLVGAGVLTMALLYRRIDSIAKLTVVLWAGMIVTVVAVILTGIPHFNPAVAFDYPPDAFAFSRGFFLGMCAAATVGIYDYLGYYDICYIGEEVREPGRVIPRSIIISLIAVAAIYLLIHLSIIGTVPWRSFVPEAEHPNEARFVAATLMERVHGITAAKGFSLMVMWTALASVFALMLGYSRVIYAAARDGYFFRAFAKLHATGGFPYLAILVIGIISIGCSFLSLDTVIAALISTRLLIQFVGQIVAVMLMRKLEPNRDRPYRMWLYPATCLLAMAGWLILFATADRNAKLAGLASLVAGVIAFLIWSARVKQWPFGEQSTVPESDG